MALPLEPALRAEAGRQRRPVLGAPIDVVSAAAARARIATWAAQRESRVVCICNVHSVVTARQDPAFHAAIEQADLATPDGAPVAWMLRQLGAAGQARVSGPDLMADYLHEAAARGEAVFLYGSTEATLQALQKLLPLRHPGLRIAGAISPPFRPLTPEEDEAHVRAINASGAGTVWVSLGCPKQELWMAAHRGRVQAVMLGVGAAFDFHAGTVARAPAWMREHGLEWLHRLASEPRRLWRRYLVTNTLFVWGALRQLLGARA
ncbi:WecB/TagA/CpsF family glycosyltransferase [Rubrivivax rivuli]|uniref:Glycosyltransferase n=1 Tax=Rubrivivax rivuli TaxID=1862385 RepID=A0A437RC26_9BURK|nr:WecB/TagA/CpsF family glycosyltransferase [Rubrivivax rivuli]RVU44341.1 glycosyltransferase [Rubrivivax rivuli]